MIRAAKNGYSDKWATPPEVYKALNDEFQFNFDPCPITWKEGDPDALEMEWGTRTFCNPPYSIVKKFVEKAVAEAAKGKLVVLLVNACVDVGWFHEHIYQKPGVEVRFFRGRLKFVNPGAPEKKMPSPRPSMLVIFRGATSAHSQS